MCVNMYDYVYIYIYIIKRWMFFQNIKWHTHMQLNIKGLYRVGQVVLIGITYCMFRLSASCHSCST